MCSEVSSIALTSLLPRSHACMNELSVCFSHVKLLTLSTEPLKALAQEVLNKAVSWWLCTTCFKCEDGTRRRTLKNCSCKILATVADASQEPCPWTSWRDIAMQRETAMRFLTKNMTMYLWARSLLPKSSKMFTQILGTLLLQSTFHVLPRERSSTAVVVFAGKHKTFHVSVNVFGSWVESLLQLFLSHHSKKNVQTLSSSDCSSSIN